MILDTNAVSAWIGRDSNLVEVLKDADELYLPVIVIGEYRMGILNSRNREALELAWRAIRQTTTELPILASTAEIYGQIRLELKTSGRPIPDNDTWIAALAREHATSILSRDLHFDNVGGIQRLEW